MMRARFVLVTAAVLAAPALAACGSSDHVSARTTACRHFLLHGGTGTSTLTAHLTSYVDGDTGLADALTNEAAALRSAATEAGLTKDLSDADVRIFRKLVDTLDALSAVVASEAQVDAPPATLGGPVESAVKAIRARCS
jgi:hypothetical protein